jgi:Leucine-rich repeat (LRR) protein
MSGELPRGLPQDVVKMIFQSLISHSALNSTTLHALKRCELDELQLSNIRGVCDDWFFAFDAINHESSYTKTTGESRTNTFRRLTSSFDSDSSLDTFPSLDKDESEDEKTSCIQEIMLKNIKLLDLCGSHHLSDQGLLMLGGGLMALEVARLDECHSIVGRGLSLFSNSYQLRHLSLTNCRCLTDDALHQIAHLRSITSLSLSGCRCLTDSALQSISYLDKLTKLDLTNCDLITDDGIKHLDHLSELQEISLAWCKLITDNAIHTLVSHPRRSETMRVLRLARCKISDVGISLIGYLASLEELDLNGCSTIGSKALVTTLEKLKRLNVLDLSYLSSSILRTSWQGTINSLKFLDLSFSNVMDTHMAKFTFIPQLQVLHLSSCPIGDATISHLVDNNVVPNLEKLDLSDTDVTDFSMNKFHQFRKLTHLSLNCCNITNVGLRHLENMKNLEVLNLDSRDVDDEGLVFFETLSNLRSLDLFSGRITDVRPCFHIVMNDNGILNPKYFYSSLGWMLSYFKSLHIRIFGVVWWWRR